MIKILKNLKKIDLLYLVASIGLIVFQVWLDLTMPDYTARLTSSVSSGDILKEEVLKNGGMMLLCAFGSMSAAIATGWFSSHIAANFAKTLRTKLFDKITSFSDREMNYFTTPSLITRTGNDVVQMQMLVAMGMQVMIKAPILAVWALFKISVTSIEWTTATLCTIAVMLVTIGTVVGLSYPKFKMIQKLTDNLNDVTREGVSGVRVVRAFNAESYQEGKFDKVNRDVTRTHLFTSRTMGVLFPIITLCMSGLTLAIYWIGAVLVNATANPLERIDTIGNMTAFSQYALQVVMAFMMLVAIFILLPRSMVSARRINEVLDTAPSITYISSDGDTKTRKKKAKQDSSSSGRLEFENVFFSYPDASNPCLKDISFAASPGETLAIIGATGSGKTSLISLITRFYDATQGRVLIDGRDIKDFTKKELEDTVSIATQKAILFSGSIRSNITYGSKDAPSPDDVDKEQPESEEKDNAQPESDASDTPIDPRINRALKISHSDFVFDLDSGINANVAQGGTNFSGGQKQRLAIARAVYKDAKIYIFDDSFSALDYKTDMLVRRDIRENMKNSLVIIVAQRIGTIRNADRILVLDEGRIVGSGRHDELLKNCDVYRDIALSQLSEEEL